VRKVAYVLIGLLALIGAAVLAVNVGWNVGLLPTCGTPLESASAAPDGRTVLVTGVADCGSKKRTTARLLAPTGKTYLLFTSAPAAEQIALRATWRSSTELELSFSHAAEVEFPADGFEALNVFGETEVRYKRL
jgi:hypothetical protein